jgi:hypothetical protein
MNLTAAEIARAVNKHENYVRQHIHRGHLPIQRRGRSVFVRMDDAVRWAQTRGLPFSLPDALGSAFAEPAERTARLTVLALTDARSHTRNVFTLLRHRRRDALGPWAAEAEEAWHREDLGQELALFSFGGTYAACRKHLDRVVATGVLDAPGREIHYELHRKPRKHWAYRDHGHRSDASIRSPFSTHSAAITEYWSFVDGPRERWLELSDTLPARLPAGLRRLGFALERCPERVGNVVVAGAEDAITCRLTAHPDRTLRLQVDAEGLFPEAYRATIWARHSGDEVLRREVPVQPGQTMIEMFSEVDSAGFAICRSFDGQCVDFVDNLSLSEVHRAAPRTAGHGAPALRMPSARDSLHFAPTGTGLRDAPRTAFDRGVRRRWLRRVAHQREIGARRELVRLGRGRFRDAAKHFLSLLGEEPEDAGPVYLADPCFVGHTMADDVAQLFVDVCSVLGGRQLRILCAEPEPHNSRPWWVAHARQVKANVAARTFVNRSDERGCFHDRYLITSKREVLITNSFNGWNKYGVTFVSLPYGVYRAEAEELWAMELESPASDILVREIS